MIGRALRFDYPGADLITFLDQEGDTIVFDSLLRITDYERWSLDYYAAEGGAIVQAVVRAATPADRHFQERYLRAVNDGPELRTVVVDCTKQVAFLQEVFDRDQAYRRDGTVDYRTDHDNLERITSFLDQCDVPGKSEVSQEQLAAIWAALQHGNLATRERYMPHLETAVERGQPQLYGTQVGVDAAGNNFLQPLASPDSVELLRAELEMGPLQEYLDQWGIDLDSAIHPAREWGIPYAVR